MTYSDEKNPHVTHLRDYCRNDPENHGHCRDWGCAYRSGTGCYFSNCITSYEEGYQQAEKRYGWKRNCPETPVPCCGLPGLLLIRLRGGKVEIPRAALDDAFELRNGSVAKVSDVIQWFTVPIIPPIEEE